MSVPPPTPVGEGQPPPRPPALPGQSGAWTPRRAIRGVGGHSRGPPPLPSFAVGQSEGTATVSGRARVGPLRPCPGGLRLSRRPRPEPPPLPPPATA